MRIDRAARGGAFPDLLLADNTGSERRLAGPVIERYGSARPWPWDRFDDD